MAKSINENEMPRWLVRRWRLLKAVLSNPDFLKLLPDLAAEYQTNNLPTANCLKAIRDFNIPGDCAPAIWELLEHPELINNEQELLSHIKPPIEYVSYKSRQRGLTDNPSKAFEYWEKKRQEARSEGRDFEAEFEGIFLEVAAFTTKEELMKFVDDYFDSKLKPLLQEGEGYYTPSELRTGRITAPNPLNEEIMALYDSGKKPSEIAKILYRNKRGYYEPTNIRKRIAWIKKQRGKRPI